MSATVRVHTWRGVAAVTLSSGELEATFVPEHNLLGTSLRLGGEEYLALRGGLAAHRRRSTTGLPLLAPWANRLGGNRYRAAGVRVALDGTGLKADANGLPIHGTMTWRHAWTVDAVSTGGRAARMRASFAYEDPALLAAFPFPHRLEAEIVVDGGSLWVRTGVRPTSDRPVPVSFGYHPYLRLPRGRRSTWRLVLPERRRLLLDDRIILSGPSVEERAEARAIGGRTFDTPYALGRDRTFAIEGADRRLRVRFDAGYPFAQVYLPPRSGAVCIEPMTAPGNALVRGGYPVVEPGEVFTARFAITPERLPR